MKEKIKEFMFYLLLIFSISIVCLFVFNMFTIKTKIELNDNETNLERLDYLKDRIYLLEETSCSLILKDMIAAYEKTSFDGEVKLTNLREYFYSGSSFIQFYTSIKENCGMSDEVMKELGLPNDSINSITYMENIMMDHMYSYELRIYDYYVRGVSQSSIRNLEYKTCKSSELDMIEKTLNYVGGVLNE